MKPVRCVALFAVDTFDFARAFGDITTERSESSTILDYFMFNLICFFFK